MNQSCLDYSDACSGMIYQTVDVELPIILTPTVKVGRIKIACCGEPRTESCRAVCGGGLEIRVTQMITYKIPVEYSANSNIGEVEIDCKKNGIATNCPCAR